MSDRVIKPKTQRGKRHLEKVAPKIIENDKSSIFIRGVNANNVMIQVLKDFVSLKRPHSVFFSRKNDIKPFEDASSLEFFARKNDTALFMFGSHNKKRPNNLVVGRMFDHQVLDMFEFHVENFKSLQEFKVPKVPVGTKPMLIFSGEVFENVPEYKRLKNLFMDFFRGPCVEFISVKGLGHVLMFTETKGKIAFRSYRVDGSGPYPALSASNVNLTEIGPRMDFTLRRHKVAPDDLFRLACKKPKQLKVTKIKNIQRDDLGTTHGRIHMERQDYDKLQTRKLKGLKNKKEETKDVDDEEKESGNEKRSAEDGNMEQTFKKLKV